MEAKVKHVKHVQTTSGTAIGMTRYAGFGIVRDKDGKPRIDDPASLHPLQIGMLTAGERQVLGLWDGVFGRDADGWKRLRAHGPDQYLADEPIRALSELVIDNKVYRVQPRPDLKTGQTITVRRT